MHLFKINGGKLQEDSSFATSKKPSVDSPQSQTEEEKVNLTHNAMEVGMHEVEPSYQN